MPPIDPTRNLGGLGASLNISGLLPPDPQFTAAPPPGIQMPNPNMTPQAPPPGVGVGASAPPMAPPGASPPVVPGVSGITPGAIERRLGFNPPSFQANPGLGVGPSMAARAMSPNITGVEPGAVRSPLAGIQQLLQQRGGSQAQQQRR